MDGNEDGVMIALAPIISDWCRIEVPHLTLVYAGKKADLAPTTFNELAKDAAAIAMMSRPVQTPVLGTAVFGSEGEEKVNVIRLRPTPELAAMRHQLEKWNKSEHPFQPHVTIGPLGLEPDVIPPAIAFDRIMVGWGSEYLTFWLRRM